MPGVGFADRKAVAPANSVKPTGQPKGGGRLFLNSEKDFRSELNFTVVLNGAAMTSKWAKATGETFKDKVIRVTVIVSEFGGAPQGQVDDEKQLEVIKGN